jgi:glycerol uptake facilitator-like aquaporin
MSPAKYLAEFIGTFALTLLVSLSILVGAPLSTPLIAALTLGTFVYILGSISGAHFNPAVTISLATIRKISLVDTILYILFQIAGAMTAMLVAQMLTEESLNLTRHMTMASAIAEAFGAFFLVFGISAVVHGKAPHDASGIVIGSSLFLGLTATAGFSNGILNPAVALGLGSISVVYLLAPIVGGICGAQLYSALCGEERRTEERKIKKK